MTYPAHDRDRFYKYMSAETAVKVLEASTVRYSSPLLFNDPFDVQCGLDLQVQTVGLHELLLHRLHALVRADREPAFVDADAPGALAVRYGRSMAPTHGFPMERAREVLAPAFDLVGAHLERLRSDYQRHVWTEVLPNLRVFSVSEDRDNLLMWAHYADEHRGVVLEFRVSAEIDNPLCIATKVAYPQTPPALFDDEEFLGYWFGTGTWDRGRISLGRYAATKGSAWQHEREWRVWYPVEPRQGPLYEDCAICPNELVAVYLGCRISGPDQARILRTLNDRHRGVQAFVAQKAKGRFDLAYAAI